MRSQHAIPVENPLHPGTPDVSYVGGWIELKQIEEWPKRPSTVVRVEHNTPQQRIWQLRERKAGGTCWVLLQCRRDWLLFEAMDAVFNLGSSTKEELLEIATYVSHKGPTKELLHCILQNQSAYSLTEDDVERLNKTLRNASR